LTIIMAVSGENDRELGLEKARGELNKRLAARGRNRIGRSTSSEDQWREAGTDPLMLGNVTMDEISKSSDDNVKAAFAKAAKRGVDLRGRMSDLISSLTQSTAGSGAGDGAATAGKFTKPEVTAFEKMGAVFGRGGNVINDYARSTADNTRKTADNTAKAVALLANLGTLNTEPVFE
jgi:hypothetical protein